MQLSTRDYYRAESYSTPVIYNVDKVDTGGAEPVSLDDMKAWLRVDHTEDDDTITSLIPAARAGIESYCNISITEKTVTMIADWSGEWQLPYAPVKSVTSVSARYGYGAYESVVLNQGYNVDGPMFRFCGGRVKVEYITGMVTVPPDLLQDIKRVVAYLYEHRGDEAMTSLQGGMERPKGMDQAMELFAKRYRKIWA